MDLPDINVWLALVLAVLGAMREVVGSGTLLSGIDMLIPGAQAISVFGEAYPGFLVAVLPPGAFFTLGAVGSFSKEMTAGAGYIALAALIFGRWNPIYAAFAALLFGFAENLQYGLAIIGSPVPSEFLLMLPYVLTVVAVAGLVGKVTGPAAAGKAYIKS